MRPRPSPGVRAFWGSRRGRGDRGAGRGGVGLRAGLRELDGGGFAAGLSWETRRRSTFDAVAAGERVNVEYALTIGDRIDGHLVRGYVNAVGKVVRVDPEGDARRVWIRPPERTLRQVEAKGPVAVDLAAATGTGVSAAERAATVRRLADPDARPGDFLPGARVPDARGRGCSPSGGGHTEATVALCAAAGLPPVGVCCEVMRRDGVLAGEADLELRALRWGLPLVGMDEMSAWL